MKLSVRVSNRDDRSHNPAEWFVHIYVDNECIGSSGPWSDPAVAEKTAHDTRVKLGLMRHYEVTGDTFDKALAIPAPDMESALRDLLKNASAASDKVRVNGVAPLKDAAWIQIKLMRPQA